MDDTTLAPPPALARRADPALRALRERWIRRAAGVLLLAALCGGAVLVAALAYREGVLALGTTLQTIRVVTWAALAVFVMAVGVLIAAARRGSGKAVAMAAGAIGVAVVVAAPPIYLWQRAQTLPKIHDVSTDTENPPAFVAVVPLRQGARNPVAYDPKTAEQQKAGYPDIRPVLLDVPPAKAWRRAEAAARSLRWDIVASDPAALRLEATATTLLLGFKDDVVVRITPQGTGSRVDVRSLSRIGGSDFGANANRIRTFVDRLRRDEPAG